MLEAELTLKMMRWKDRTVIDGILGIDVSKKTLDVSISSCKGVRSKSFSNSSDGWRHLLDWLIAQKIQRAHACLESTGRARSVTCRQLARKATKMWASMR